MEAIMAFHILTVTMPFRGEDLGGGTIKIFHVCFPGEISPQNQKYFWMMTLHT